MTLPTSLEALLPLRPSRRVPYEISAEGLVTVLRPKILGPRWGWLLRLLARPAYRVKLDARGSFVWLQCEAGRDVQTIAAAARDHFGDPPEDAHQRAAAFLLELARGGFLALEPPPETAHGD